MIRHGWRVTMRHLTTSFPLLNKDLDMGCARPGSRRGTLGAVWPPRYPVGTILSPFAKLDRPLNRHIYILAPSALPNAARRRMRGRDTARRL